MLNNCFIEIYNNKTTRTKLYLAGKFHPEKPIGAISATNRNTRNLPVFPAQKKSRYHLNPLVRRIP